ncbi:MAG: TetR/AcrR family transcriptional regulator [Chlorobiales bacterium]|jgi:AcrR family transcriptional regulator|nr:TetR/AcrR family transcriptional regulator [Chlorobiales bacterium]
MTTDDKQRTRILELAQKRFFELGISAVTMENLAHELGISKKTMYHFFESKTALLEVLIEQHLIRLTEELAEVQDTPADFLDRAISVWTYGGQTLAALSPALRDDLCRHHPDLWRRLDGFYQERLLKTLSHQLEAGMKLNIFRSDLNKEAVLLFFCAGIEKIVTPSTLSRHSFSAEDAIKTIILLVFDGVLADSSRTAFRRRLAHEKRQNIAFKRVNLNSDD